MSGKVEVKGQLCGCRYMLDSLPFQWTLYTCKKCGKRTNLLIVPYHLRSDRKPKPR